MGTRENKAQPRWEAYTQNWTCPQSLDQLLKEYIAQAEALWDAWCRANPERDPEEHIFRLCQVRYYIIKTLRERLYYVEPDAVARDVARAVRDKRLSILPAELAIANLLAVVDKFGTDDTDEEEWVDWVEGRMRDLSSEYWMMEGEEDFHLELVRLPVLILASPLDSESKSRFEEAVWAFSCELHRAAVHLIRSWVQYERMRYAERHGQLSMHGGKNVVDLSAYRRVLLLGLPRDAAANVLGVAKNGAAIVTRAGNGGGDDGDDKPQARVGRLFRDAIRAVEAMHVADECAAVGGRDAEDE